MTNKFLTSVAAGALFLGAAIAPAAYAQDNTQPAQTQTMDQQPMNGDAATGTTPGDTAANPDAATPSEDTAQTPATGTDNTDTAQTPATGTDNTDTAQTPATPSEDTAQAPAAGESYLTAQTDDQISANTYIGQSVYTGQNESIGNVTDLIMKKDGGLVAAVVGVGGFLGIGQKNVAVPMDKITVAQNTQDGSVKLTTTETADSLKAAPEFKTLQMQAAEKAPAATGTMPADSTATGSTTAK